MLTQRQDGEKGLKCQNQIIWIGTLGGRIACNPGQTLGDKKIVTPNYEQE